MAGAKDLYHPINMETLRDLEETVAIGIPEIMLDLLNTFTVDCNETFRVLRQALTEEDLKLVEINAHALKSSSATFGAEKLSSMFAYIELAARDSKLLEIRAMIEEVSQSIEEVQNVLNAERERLQ